MESIHNVHKLCFRFGDEIRFDRAFSSDRIAEISSSSMMDLAAAASNLENASQRRLGDLPPFLGGFRPLLTAIDLWLSSSEASSWNRLNKSSPVFSQRDLQTELDDCKDASGKPHEREKCSISVRCELCLGLANQANGQIDSIGAVAFVARRCRSGQLGVSHVPDHLRTRLSLANVLKLRPPQDPAMGASLQLNLSNKIAMNVNMSMLC